ncbi:MAG: terminase [Tepidiforma sp.]|uniref:terminase large subunit n=1 Tax=Tepidiforma sp. TaxID=2682230 RepID=UPI0021DD297B|nr:terminase TerL endonuclease subunit [Tepidiforma sp.]GIW15676.1 MAG: terminase [Tepidiforma sp.]
MPTAAPAESPVREYAEAVVRGAVPAGELVRLACERHLRDLEEGRRRGLRWDEAEARRAIEFMQHLRQSRGQWAGQPLELLPWQQFVVGSLFGWRRADGLRRFRRGYIEVARKNGKSTMAAAIALYLLLADGEPGAEVYCAATKRDQAKVTWEEAWRMVQQTPALRAMTAGVPSRANLTVPSTWSKLEALGRDADTLDGLNPHGVIIDELHAHEDRDTIDRLETALGARRQPLLLFTTTAGLEDRPAWVATRGYAERVVRGFEDDRWFVYIACMDPADDWTDPANWPKANPSLGQTLRLEDLEQEAREALGSPARQAAFRALRLNTPAAIAGGWLDLREWDACCDPGLTLEAFRGRACWAGLDLATTRDTTALALVTRLDDGRFAAWEEYWVPAETIAARSREDQVPYVAWAEAGWLHATPGAVTDYGAVRARLRELVDDWGLDIRELAYDRWNASQLIVELRADGLTCTPHGQGHASMAGPCRDLETLLGAGRLVHAPNPVTRWMAGNVVTEMDAAGNQKPSRRNSTDRIDGIVALLMALGRAAGSSQPESAGPTLWIDGEDGG